MKCLRRAAAMMMLVGIATVASAQSIEERAAARQIVEKRGDAVVTIMATLKARMSAGGRDNAMPDQAVQASATVLDASGLTVLALSALDPGNVISKNPKFVQAKMTMTTEVVDVKMRLPDGKEVPAKVVLRDSDLDLLFVRPEAAPATPLVAVEPSSAKLTAMDPVVLVQRFGEETGWKAAAALGTIELVVEKPRTFYMVAFTTTGNRVGASVFDLKGQFAGVVTLRVTEQAKTNALTGLQGDVLQTLGMLSAVIPVADIREVAKQAK
jgi:S1-C subfamily serine protease